MRPLWIAAAALSAIMALTACKNRKDEPIPGPKAASPALPTPAHMANVPAKVPTRAAGAARPQNDPHHGASGISWFQGSVEEGFSVSCPKCTAMLFRH
jgi:hypothetical protein